MVELRERDELMSCVSRAADGDGAAWAELVRRFDKRLQRMVALRMDQRLQGRIDPADVVQEAYIDAFAQLQGYLVAGKYPFFLWLRMVTGARLAKTHRYHLGAQIRDVNREISIFKESTPGASSAQLAIHLLDSQSEPIHGIARAEMNERLVTVLQQMDDLDREVLSLRHFEQLTTPEVAVVLEISEAAAAKRYLRALEKLRGLIGSSATL